MVSSIEESLINAFEMLFEEGVMSENIYDFIEETLVEDPSLCEIFRKKFKKESDIERKEVLAKIVLSIESFEDGILFLKNECNYNDEDFDGYKGYER